MIMIIIIMMIIIRNNGPQVVLLTEAEARLKYVMERHKTETCKPVQNSDSECSVRRLTLVCRWVSPEEKNNGETNKHIDITNKLINKRHSKLEST